MKEENMESEKSEKTVIKKEEFAAFIKALEDGSISFWQEIAEALGVCPDTISDWQKLPEAKAAKQKGINKCLREMEKAGNKDWRMWHERLKLLKMTVTEKHDLTSKGEKITPIYGGLSEVQGHDGDKEDI